MYIILDKDSLHIIEQLKEFTKLSEEQDGVYKAGEIHFKDVTLPVFVSSILVKEIQLRDDDYACNKALEVYAPYIPKELLNE